MQLLSSFTLLKMRILLGVKCAKVNNRFVMSNLSFPTPFTFGYPGHKANSLQPCSIAMFAVCSVLAASSFSEVFKPIISFVTIYMVYMLYWLFARHIDPCNPMGCIGFPIYRNVNVSFGLFHISSPLPNFDFWARKIPKKLSSFWIIVKNGCKICVFHTGILPDPGINCKRN